MRRVRIIMAASSTRMSEIGQRYATAFFELAQESGSADAIEQEVRDLASAIEQNDDLARFVASPVIERSQQSAAMEAILQKANASQMVQNLVALVVRNGRLSALPDILAAFSLLAASARGEVSAQAITAQPLNDDQQKRLRAEIEASVGKAVNLSLSTDPDLLGGMIVKVGSRMVDTSLRTKLNRLKHAMKEA